MVITRFAPSPTGPFHIGNARTALINFLYARQQKGQMLLRVEDTDRQRSEKKFEEEIVDGLHWLGIEWAGEITHQVDRLALYRQYLEDLKIEGLAYEQGGALYFKATAYHKQLQSVEFHDLIRGKISTPIKIIDDFVIVKSDGTPLFLFTNIIDDINQGVTHVIRGEDHISNTARQLLIALALDLPPPQYAHAPIILAPDRSKLSKRHGAVSIAEYRAQGFLPEALLNFMILLGWHPSEKSKIKSQKSKVGHEYFTLDDLIKEFSLDRVQKSGAVFDIEKLYSINRHYIKALSPVDLVKRVKLFSAHGSDDPANLAKIATIVKDRLTRLVEFDSETFYFFNEPALKSNLLIYKTSNQAKTKKGLLLVVQKLRATNDNQWDKLDSLHDFLADVVKTSQLTNGDVFWPVRVALSGEQNSPGPHELLWAMGKKRSIQRLERAIKILS